MGPKSQGASHRQAVQGHDLSTGVIAYMQILPVYEVVQGFGLDTEMMPCPHIGQWYSEGAGTPASASTLCGLKNTKCIYNSLIYVEIYSFNFSPGY